MSYLDKSPVRRAAMLACASTAALGLAACKIDNRPLLARNAPEPAYSALPSPGPLDLAYAPPIQVAALEEPYDAYGWAERAYGMDRAFYQAEPDYAFAYDDVQPWGWESPDDWTMYAEPIDDGYRFYYYEPEAPYPYFVRDDEYGYAYNDDGVLVALFTLAGALLPQSYWYDQRDVAGRYYYRGEDLRRAALIQHVPVQEDYWLERAPVLIAAQTPWIQAAAQQPEWRTYRTRTNERDLRRFEPERARRAPRIDRAIQPDMRTMAAIQERQTRPDRGAFARSEGRADREDRRQDRRELREDRRQVRAAREQQQVTQQRARAEQRQGEQQRVRAQQRQERSRNEAQRMARFERDRAQETRRAERQQAQQQRQAEAGRRQEMARAAQEDRGRAEREQAQQQRQAEAGRRQEMARAAREERGRAEQRDRERAQAERNRGAERQMARAAERHAQQAAAQPQQQPQAKPERGGGGREDRGQGGGGGKGGGKKD